MINIVNLKKEMQKKDGEVILVGSQGEVIGKFKITQMHTRTTESKEVCLIYLSLLGEIENEYY